MIPEAAKEFKALFTEIDEQALARRIKDREGLDEDDEEFEEEQMPDRNVTVHFLD